MAAPRNAVAALWLALVPAACVMPADRAGSEFAPVYRPAAVVPAAATGAIYRPGYSLALFDDRRARRAGDVITITLQERTSATKTSETKIGKSTSSSLPEPTLFGSLLDLASGAGLTNSVESTAEFEGSGDSDQSNSLSGTITVVVAEVLPGGLLRVGGEKRMRLARGEEHVQISGLLREEDIAADNTVSSLRLADARIVYGASGELADANQVGWLGRFFLSPFNPF